MGHINEQVNFGNLKLDLYRGLNLKSRSQHEGLATASWNGY